MSSFATNLRCPDDGHLLRQDVSSTVHFAVCRHCHGLFFAADALARAYEHPPEVPDLSRRWRAPRAAPARQCPACVAPLQPRALDGITIDECSICRGIWLDPGEFDAARLRLRPSSPPRPRSPDALETGIAASVDIAELIFLLLRR